VRIADGARRMYGIGWNPIYAVQWSCDGGLARSSFAITGIKSDAIVQFASKDAPMIRDRWVGTDRPVRPWAARVFSLPGSCYSAQYCFPSGGLILLAFVLGPDLVQTRPLRFTTTLACYP
jgi:hypothetical protein